MSETVEAQQPYTEEEVSRMFNTEFLPTIQEIARKYKAVYEGPEIKHFRVLLTLEFGELEEPLTYDVVRNNIHMQLIPMVENEEDNEENSEENA